MDEKGRAIDRERGRERQRARTALGAASDCGRHHQNSKLTRLAITQRCSLAVAVASCCCELLLWVAVASCCCKLLLLVIWLFLIVVAAVAVAIAVGVDQTANHLLSMAVARLLSNFVNSPGRASINLCGCHNSLHISCSLCCRCKSRSAIAIKMETSSPRSSMRVVVAASAAAATCRQVAATTHIQQQKKENKKQQLKPAKIVARTWVGNACLARLRSFFFRIALPTFTNLWLRYEQWR